jgi:uncharacterized protein (UPF0335 family)
MNMAKAPDTDTISSSEVNAGHLRAFIERIERLEEEKKALTSDIKDVYGEAKANGFDVKIMRRIATADWRRRRCSIFIWPRWG